MLARRSFLAFFGAAAGAATAVALKVKPTKVVKPPIRYVGSFHNVPIYEHDVPFDGIEICYGTMAVTRMYQHEINERRSAMLFYAGEQWTPEQIEGVRRG